MGVATDLYDQGRRIRSQERDKIEKSKIGTLRVGNSGCITDDGFFIGTNPYLVLARFMGYQTKNDDQSMNIFDQGYANEVAWEENIKATGRDFRCEEDYPLILDVNGVPLTGRPDMVIGDDVDGDFIPQFGMELKAICSTGTSKMFKSLEPKTDNLIQAAQYSMGFNLPWYLIYTQGFNYFGTKAGKIEFELGWEDDDHLYFVRPDKQVVSTIIRQKGIREFWEAMIEARDARDHSFFRRIDMGYDGEDYQTWDSYNNFLLAVDSSLPFDEWEEKAAIVANSEWTMNLKKEKSKEGYYLKNVLDNRTSKVYNSKSECREALWKKNKGM